MFRFNDGRGGITCDNVIDGETCNTLFSEGITREAYHARYPTGDDTIDLCPKCVKRNKAHPVITMTDYMKETRALTKEYADKIDRIFEDRRQCKLLLLDLLNILHKRESNDSLDALDHAAVCINDPNALKVSRESNHKLLVSLHNLRYRINEYFDDYFNKTIENKASKSSSPSTEEKL